MRWIKSAELSVVLDELEQFGYHIESVSSATNHNRVTYYYRDKLTKRVVKVVIERKEKEPEIVQWFVLSIT